MLFLQLTIAAWRLITNSFCIHRNIAIWLADALQSVLEVIEDVANNVVFDLHPNYKNIHQKIYVHITNLPVYDQIRNIR